MPAVSHIGLFRMNIKDMLVRGTLVLICCLSFSGSALAHRVIIFGWVEGDRVMTQSKFSSNRVVKGGEISVYDSTENRILTGKTDKQGEYSFQIPVQERLKIVLSTAGGHQADWTITKKELESASHLSDDLPQTQMHEPVPGDCQKETGAAVIEKMLDSKLRPIMRHIAEANQKQVSLRDILGGIGYIIGLAGLAAYMRYRGKEKQGS
ncbi:MAG: hypothetical protein HN580_00750 [Deltaproteobacteria bacterium]|jgi:nickel transport protein|nr:hypothetical protein [Deltaproteobacteria bacterium]MBT4268081.1 hypothetical protein [Deltaproteobacteria bacterium]MBT4641451.1 hypothetical protein [Deltaproteobacteria bacterium]MBT6500066.1 hypothetical protein [Deltaproteobacteria bacterium]MBT6610551.1 hypothetical protein [Deltaproteobacteria bacterium]